MTEQLQAVKSLLAQQQDTAGLISRAITNLKKVGEAKWTKQRLKGRLENVRNNWQRFQDTHFKLLSLREAAVSDVAKFLSTNTYFVEDGYSDCQELFLEAQEFMETQLDSLINLSQLEGSVLADRSLCAPQPNGSTFSHRLPKLDLPKFDGNFLNWAPFRDLFISLVGSSAVLSNVEKLHYLKLSLTGHAAERIKCVPLTGDQFQRVWDQLLDYYDNTRLLVQVAIRDWINLPPVKNESATEIEALHSAFTRTLLTLESLERPVTYWDDFIVQLALMKLDNNTIKEWEQHLGSSTAPPTWEQLQKFLISRVRGLEAINVSAKRFSTHSTPVRIHHVRPAPTAKVQKSKFAQSSVSQPANPQHQCSLCSGSHYIASCSAYKLKTPQQRREFVIQKALCFNCLGNHRVTDCRTARRCLQCGQQHHTTIHGARVSTEQTQVSEPPAASTSSAITTGAVVTHASQCAQPRRTPVLLATAEVKIQSIHGDFITGRLLLDQGSEVSFVSENLVQRLHLRRQRASVPLLGIGAQQSCTSRGSVTLRVKPHFTSEAEINITAFVLPKLTAKLPSVDASSVNWSQFNNIVLADPKYTVPGAVDVILGADVYGQIINGQVIKGTANTPIAQGSILGWIISGPVGSETTSQLVQGYHCAIDHELHKLLQRFWTMEEVALPEHSVNRSPEEEECEQHFLTTHTRTNSGRYVVRLPLRSPAEVLGDSRTPALRMLSRMQHRLISDTNFLQAYTAFLSEYECLHHMEPIPPDSPEPTRVFYLPHHGVIKEGSPTTRLRVVFNGSSRTNLGTSLNDILHIGAKVQNDLSDVLIWFRRFLYVFATDIEKMYRQIQVHSNDWDLQRILWTNRDNALTVFRLTTVTYGLACAPFLANRTLLQLVADEGKRYPLAIPSILKGRYVDDIFGGADTIDQARIVVNDIVNLCTAGGFPLQKWTSNEPEVLTAIAPELQTLSGSKTIDEASIVRTLGLSWHPESDSFRFSVQLSESPSITKRSVLSQVARVFDPLGFLAPVTIQAKLFLQELWLSKLDWDEPVSMSMAERWMEFRQQLKGINKVSIPRWMGTTSSDFAAELHGFSDASQVAMAAAVYLRVHSDVDCARVILVCAKTKVAPLKRLTIPRLELSAAVILARLASHVREVLELNHIPVHLWTDSSVTLAWVSSHPSRWKDFVQNRVCVIQETVPSARWHFVPGKDNPADCASRGITSEVLATHRLWWHGPQWLARHSSTWPLVTHQPSDDVNLEERPVPCSTASQAPTTQLWDLLDRCSTLTRLLRLTATVRRAYARFRDRSKSSLSDPLTPGDLSEAQLFWVKQIQEAEFGQEIKIIAANSVLPRSNSLTRLTPFIDQLGLLRVGGRLRNSALNYDAKHPLILPRKSHLTTLVIDSAHRRTLHGGTQVTLALIRQSFWIVGGRSPVRSFILRCVPCSRQRGIRAQQIMGQLPTSRAIQSRPFLHTGVDYAGPFTIKTWRGRGAKTQKGYIALFVCFTTSAVHLELVTEYTTAAFLAAYHRFTSRRGICSVLYSDCGTNFIGADKELKELFSRASQQAKELANLLAADGTKWTFNPPAAPHFGGKWEAGVKSVKHHLKRVMGDSILTYEEFATLLVQIEGVLNSRPLSPISDDSTDLNALTPGHFLIGSAINLVPEPCLLDIKTSRLSRWQHLQQLQQQFWKRWSVDVLQRYHSTSKWLHPSDAIKLGSLVLITDERYPPSKWPLGRVIQLHAGADGYVRVVTVKTQHSTYQRPISKLCLLPVSTASSQVEGDQ